MRSLSVHSSTSKEKEKGFVSLARPPLPLAGASLTCVFVEALSPGSGRGRADGTLFQDAFSAPDASLSSMWNSSSSVRAIRFLGPRAMLEAVAVK